MMAMAMKRKATGLEGFNVLLSWKNLKLERTILNIIEGRGVCVGETKFQRQTFRSKGATHNRVRDTLYEKINIIVEAMMPNKGKKKKTRGKAFTAKYQLEEKWNREKSWSKCLLYGGLGQRCALLDSWTHTNSKFIRLTYGLMDSWTHGLMNLWTYELTDLWTYGLMDSWTHGLILSPWEKSSLLIFLKVKYTLELKFLLEQLWRISQDS